MMTQERSDMMMMMVVPNNNFQEVRNPIYGYFPSSLIRNSAKLTSNLWKGALDDCWREVNEVDDYPLFSGRQRYTVRGVLAFMNIYRSFFFKMQLSGGCLLCCFLCCPLLLSPILRQQSILRYFSSGEVDSHTQIRVTHGGLIIYQSHLLLI